MNAEAARNLTYANIKDWRTSLNTQIETAARAGKFYTYLYLHPRGYVLIEGQEVLMHDINTYLIDKGYKTRFDDNPLMISWD